MSEMVLVRNRTSVTQQAGLWVLRPGEAQAVPLSVVPTFGDSLEVVQELEPETVSIYRSVCPDCGHSLCLLARGVQRALEAQGHPVVQLPWRKGVDQPPVGQTLLCNSGTFSGPAGFFSWPHPDADRCPRRHAELLARHWAGHICSSEAVKASLVAAGIAEHTCHVVHDAIDGELFQPEGEVLEGWGDRFVFLMAGALNPRKGFDVALEAYGRAFGADDPVVLVLKDYLYGWGRPGLEWCQQTLQEWRRRRGEQAPAVEYVYDTWDRPKLAAAYRRAALHGAYLMPSRYEGFGLTGLEALACGCRLGTTDYSGQLDYAREAAGATRFAHGLSRNEANPLYWERDEQPQWAEPDPESIAGWMRRMVEEPPRRAELEADAHRLRARFSFSRMAEELTQALGCERGGRGLSKPGRSYPAPSALTVPITRDETLGIGIPTRGRPGYLAALLGALWCQHRRPEALCLVDDDGAARKDPAVSHLLQLFSRAGVRVLFERGTKRGASPNHQVALETLGTDLVLRLDDDLLPDGPEFVGRLYALLNRHPEVGAVAGVYPKFDESPRDYRPGRPGMTNTLSDMVAGRVDLQFRNWRNPGGPVEGEHLYSSWLYRASYLQAVGGFPDCYSRFGQREETDASVRLRLLGGWKLIIDPGARAWHFLAGGGRRPEGSAKAAREDSALFERRLAEWRQEVST